MLPREHEIAVDGGVTTIDGRDVSVEIRGPEATAAVSVVAAHPAVRTVLVAQQRVWVERHGGGVVEGRDIGTVVFPAAPLKVYLTASDDERARRRQRDETASARAVDVDEVRRDADAPRRARQHPGRFTVASCRRRDHDRHDHARGRRHRRRARRPGPYGGDRLMLFYRVVHWILTNGSQAVVARPSHRRRPGSRNRGLRARAVAPVDDGHPVGGDRHQAAHPVHGQGVAVPDPGARHVVHVAGRVPGGA